MSLTKQASSLIEALRPTQWIKNLSLFAAAILDGQLLNPAVFLQSVLAFIVFCCLSSSSYLINDIVDIENDRKHPFKKNRPLARGDVPIPLALTTSLVLLFVGLSLSLMVNSGFFFLCLFFVMLQYAYSLFFKKKAIFDIIGIALFFILRTFAGEIATGYHLPIWIFLTVIFLSLFIASGKRRSELHSAGTKSRQALEGYGRQLLTFYTTMFAVCTLITYSMFTFFAEPVKFQGVIHDIILQNFPVFLDRKWYMITIIPVIYGIMRYGQIIFEMQEGERPEQTVSTDIPLLFSIVTWGLMIITIIYVF